MGSGRLSEQAGCVPGYRPVPKHCRDQPAGAFLWYPDQEQPLTRWRGLRPSRTREGPGQRLSRVCLRTAALRAGKVPRKLDAATPCAVTRFRCWRLAVRQTELQHYPNRRERAMQASQATTACVQW